MLFFLNIHRYIDVIIKNIYIKELPINVNLYILLLLLLLLLFVYKYFIYNTIKPHTITFGT